MKSAATSRKASTLARRPRRSRAGLASSSISSPVVRSISAMRSGSGWSILRRIEASSSRRRTSRWSASGDSGAIAFSSGSSRCSRTSHNAPTSASSLPIRSAVAASAFGIAWPAGAPRTSADARRPIASRSRRPMRQRGPVSSRTRSELAVASYSTRSTATRSATSGASSKPPRPTTSTGIPAISNAWRSNPNWLRRRHRIAASCQPSQSGSVQCCTWWASRFAPASATASATHCASSSASASIRTRTSPASGPLVSRPSLGTRIGGSTRDCGPEAAASPATTALATSRIAPPLRKLTSSG